MRLIGQLDSPYVRRTAISLKYLGIGFEHESLSVFSNTEQLAAINPLLKVPTLVCDDGMVLLDSTLIIDYFAASSGRSILTPSDPVTWQRDVRITGLALAACEKAVQRVYEDRLRPEDKRHDPWVERIESQLEKAWREIEHEQVTTPLPISKTSLSHGVIAMVVAWTFCTRMLPDLVARYSVPCVHELAAEAETLDVFTEYPFP